MDVNGWQHYVFQLDECALHIYTAYDRRTGISREGTNDFTIN